MTFTEDAVQVTRQQGPDGRAVSIWIDRAPDRAVFAQQMLNAADPRFLRVNDGYVSVHAENGSVSYQLVGQLGETLLGTKVYDDTV